MSGNEVLYAKCSKKKSIIISSDDTSTIEDEIWDDSLLVEAYDRALDRAHAEVLRSMQNNSEKKKNKAGRSNKKKQWNVGGQCRCEYSEDLTYYEADVIDIIDDLEMCVVKYVGYENEEKVPLSKLRPSKGEMARSQQVKQALQEKSAQGGQSVSRPSGSDNRPQSGNKNIPKKPENPKGKEPPTPDRLDSEYANTSQLFKTSLMGAIPPPPPPPPHMFTELCESSPESDAMSAMLMSWYMSGYHTGYYQGLKATKK